MVRAMNELVYQGDILYWGTCEWSAQQLMEAYAIARQYNLIPPTVKQPQYNIFHRCRFEVEYGRLYKVIGLGTTIWSPLASGLLTGKYSDCTPENSRLSLPGYEWLRDRFASEEWQKRLEKIRQLTEIAEQLGTNMARLAIAWCLKNSNVSTVITGESSVEQMRDNMQAIDVVPLLSDDVLETIEKVLDNKPEPLELQ